MNDRFSAELRQHLLGVANERPTDGQLAVLAAELAVTPQRHPLVARLASFAGGSGPFPPAVARLGLVAALVAVVVGAAWLVGSNTPFSGPSESVAPPTQAPTSTPVPSVELTTLPTVAPSPDPSCMQLDQETTYLGRAGLLPVSVVVPASASSPWAGGREGFELVNAPCGGSGTVRFNALLVGHVYEDSCHWKDSSVEAPTAFDAVAQLTAQQGHDTSAPIQTTLGPFRATRLDFSVPSDFDAATCDDGILRIGGGGPNGDESAIAPGTTLQVYVAEVDSATVVITVTYRPEDATPALLAEIDAVLASLRVDM